MPGWKLKYSNGIWKHCSYRVPYRTVHIITEVGDVQYSAVQYRICVVVSFELQVSPHFTSGLGYFYNIFFRVRVHVL